MRLRVSISEARTPRTRGWCPRRWGRDECAAPTVAATSAATVRRLERRAGARAGVALEPKSEDVGDEDEEVDMDVKEEDEDGVGLAVAWSSPVLCATYF